MRRTFSVPARYRRFIEAALAMAVSETASDAACRAEHPKRPFFPVADSQYEGGAKGMCIVTVETDPKAPEPTGDFSHYTRIGNSLEVKETVAG